MPRFLLIACTQRKRPDPGPMPAIDRYDGPTFRVLRKYLREQPHANIVIYILSAEFGLIRSDRPIPDYNRRMTRRRAIEIRPIVSAKINTILYRRQWDKIGLCMGQDYFAALPEEVITESNSAAVSVLQGGLGTRLAVLRNWLWNHHFRGIDRC